MGDFDGVIGQVNLRLLGLFGLFLLLGAFWGAIRGGRRATIRLATVIVALSLALLLTPVFTGTLTGVKVSGGKTIGELIADQLPEDGAIGAATEEANGLIDFVVGCAAAIVNLILFIVLYFIFKGISWIVYAVLAANFAKKAKKGGNPKRYRWAGVGVGLATGVVFFAFFAIPLTGFLGTAHNALGHNPQFAVVKEYNELNKDARVAFREAPENDKNESLLKAIDTMNDIDDSLENGIFAKVTKYTGIQGFGHAAFKYLTTVRADGHKVTVAQDIEKLGALAKDGMSVAIEFNGAQYSDKEGMDKMIAILEDEKNFNAINAMLNRIFDIKFVQGAFDYAGKIIDGFAKEGTLDENFAKISEEEGFNAKAYAALKEVTSYKNLRADLNAMFSKDKTLTGTEKRNLIVALNAVNEMTKGGIDETKINNISNDEIKAMSNLLAVFTDGKSLAKILRLSLSSMLDKIEVPENDLINFTKTFDSLKAKLDPESEEKLDAEWWADMLTSLKEMAKFAVNFKDISNLDKGDLDELFAAILGNDQLREIVAPIVVDLLNNTLADQGIILNIAEGKEADFLDIIAGGTETFIEMIKGDEGDIQFETANGMLEVFGDTLVDLANLGGANPAVTIDVSSVFPEPEDKQALADAIDAKYPGDANAATRTAIKRMFGLNV
jgi:hypothetical protein